MNLRTIAISCISVLLLVAVLPKTNWILKNQIGFLSGNLRPNIGTADGTTGYSFELIPSISDPFLDAIDKFERDPGPLIALAKERPNDVYIWAQMARRSAPSLRELPPKTAASDKDSKANLVKQRQFLKLAIENGKRADPGNALFSTLGGCLAFVEGRPLDAEADFLHAASLKRFDSYGWQEAEARIALTERQYGYRGQYQRLLAYFSVTFPELSGLMAASRQIRKKGTPRLRGALVLAGAQLSAHTSEGIGVYVGRGMREAALRGNRAGALGSEEERRMLEREWAISLERESGIPGVLEAVKRTEYRSQRNVEFGSVDFSRTGTCLGGIFLSFALLLALSSLLSATVLRERPMSDALQSAIPHFLLAGAWLALALPYSGANALTGFHIALAFAYFDGKWARVAGLLVAAAFSLAGALSPERSEMILLFILSAFAIGLVFAANALTFAQRKRLGLIAGLALTLATLSSGLDGGLWIPAAAWILALFAFRKGNSWFVTGFRSTMTVALGLAGAALAVIFEDRGLLSLPNLLILLGSVLVVSIFATSLPRKAQQNSLACACILCTLGYVGSVGWELSSDARDAMIIKSELNYANAMRASK